MHTDTPADLQLLGRAVKQAQYRQHRAMDSALAEVGTTLAQWDALRAISRAPGSSARDLAAATFQTEQAFGTLASRLTAQNLIERRPGHGRRIEHHLTPEGERILAAGHKVADEVLKRCFAPLPEPDRATLLELLRRLNEASSEAP
ncbi:MarR family winged helix-turn-helix transcriptional regulator [Streptomyces spinosirectus]|jgi:DNA-binding MarR family transcriptional regulator|uniref:MarR family winged helix-turn-helix transcriptional regulator n=1 Tax=Streptomyces TaxID=1883 RepID=UPI000D3AE3FB|nr:MULTISPECIES: MarR family winged helix-turn-helix transcriptional regulator [Streptomyces]MBY8345257.1 winged helix-turn-helix transcriptional regulator [Streptomyces plumbidurans]PTM91154.1 DNA-binding MarR family transcriptional regulator [Streptomyces sp. VMFN-G11Ma]UIR20147.1 MarR family winged helix-turn-helix transcriptional regulator [Streptomyces spinosirectus]